jgi:hypothetical protein
METKIKKDDEGKDKKDPYKHEKGEPNQKNLAKYLVTFRAFTRCC